MCRSFLAAVPESPPGLSFRWRANKLGVKLDKGNQVRLAVSPVFFQLRLYLCNPANAREVPLH
jgi:hypothetical protein